MRPVFLAITFVFPFVMQGQAIQHERTFEVESVKVTSGGLFAISPIGQDRFSVRNISLVLLVGMAFGVNETQIVGGPAWRDSERYEITAKAESGINLTYDELRPRLQELLKRRFKLSTHRETHEESGYALVSDKQGPKLKPREAGSNPAILPGAIRAESISMDVLASILARVVGRPVTNQTGLTGNYEITLDYAPDTSTDSRLPAVFTALQEQVGLRLEAKKVSLEFLVIDHAEHPTED